MPCRAVLGSGTESAKPQQKIEVPRQDLREASNRYDTLTSRVSPFLYRGIEDILHRRKDTFNSGEDLNFIVVAPISGFFRVVAATYPPENPLRQFETKVGGGLRGFITERKAAGYTRTNVLDEPKFEGNRPVFDRAGGLLGEIPPSLEAYRWNQPLGDKWIYCRPIFEKSTATPWSNRLVGMLNVRSSADDADSFFKTRKFQHQVDSIATEVSLYLDAIQVLTGEEKL